MELENQVCSLELAKRLKELGVPQDSYCYWSNVHELPQYSILLKSEWTCDAQIGEAKGRRYYRYDHSNYMECDLDDRYSAFTVAELGEMLPNKYWDCRNYSEDTEANARAKMLCYLLENKLIDLKGDSK